MNIQTQFGSLLHAMDVEMRNAPEIVRPSKYWADLNRRHLQRTAEHGIENFKRTLAKDYFTWMRVLPWDAQIRFLVKNLPLSATLKAAIGVIRPFKHPYIPLLEGFALNFLTRLIWQYAERVAPAEIAALTEPAVGNPPDIRLAGRIISQDLANSILEFLSFEGVANGVVCELGGGYGRNAFVTASLAPVTKYIMVDIAPALGVAQEYLGQVFPGKRHFQFRPFDDFEAVREEFEAAEFAFFLPHQLAKIPADCIDLFLNISSLHEMHPNQIAYYLDEIYRTTRPGGNFYFKAWKVSTIPFEDIVVREEEYPLDRWRRIYRREPKVQSHFFETLLRKPAD